MGTVIIFAIVTLVCLVATFRELKQKNALSIFFAGASFLVFGWFTIMTVMAMTHGAGVPAGH